MRPRIDKQIKNQIYSYIYTYNIYIYIYVLNISYIYMYVIYKDPGDAEQPGRPSARPAEALGGRARRFTEGPREKGGWATSREPCIYIHLYISIYIYIFATYESSEYLYVLDI